MKHVSGEHMQELTNPFQGDYPTSNDRGEGRRFRKATATGNGEAVRFVRFPFLCHPFLTEEKNVRNTDLANLRGRHRRRNCPVGCQMVFRVVVPGRPAGGGTRPRLRP